MSPHPTAAAPGFYRESGLVHWPVVAGQARTVSKRGCHALPVDSLITSRSAWHAAPGTSSRDSGPGAALAERTIAYFSERPTPDDRGSRPLRSFDSGTVILDRGRARPATMGPARCRNERWRSPRRAGTGVGVRSTHRLVSLLLDRPPRSTPGRRVPPAAGTHCELTGVRETPAPRVLRAPQRPLINQLPIGPGRSRRIQLLPTTRRGVGVTVPYGRRSATSPSAARRATSSTSPRRRRSTASASPRAVCSIPEALSIRGHVRSLTRRSAPRQGTRCLLPSLQLLRHPVSVQAFPAVAGVGPRGASRTHPTPARSRPCSPARPKFRAARTDRWSTVPRTGCRTACPSRPPVNRGHCRS